MPKKYDDETRREMRNKRQKAWYDKHKDYMREYRKARYEKLKADRVCVVCRKPMGDDPHCYCESCREYQKKVYNNRNAMAVDAVEIPTDNVDDMSRAVIGIGIFRLSFCLNVRETDAQGEPVFRCAECPFEDKKTRKCAVKMFLKTRATEEQRHKFLPIV